MKYDNIVYTLCEGISCQQCIYKLKHNINNCQDKLYIFYEVNKLFKNNEDYNEN